MILLKKFISFLLFFILVFLALNVYAAEDSSENPTVNIKYDYSSVVSWFSGGLGLGDFSGIEEHSYLKISFTLDYDSSLLRYIDINPGNNWTLLSSEDSNNFVLETNDAMPNTFIININFYPDPSVENLEELHYVYFENIVVTNNSNLNENYDCSNQDFDAETEFENRYKLQGIAIKRVILKKTKDTLLELPK